MSQDLSGFGLQVTIVATSTFPVGFNVTQFADDADPFDNPVQQLNEVAMGLNGDLVNWSSANPITITLNVIPGSEDDINLSILAQANRVGLGKSSSRDNITMTAVYPDGRAKIYSGGKLTNAMMSDSVASSGRLKSKPYTFAFENSVGTA